MIYKNDKLYEAEKSWEYLKKTDRKIVIWGVKNADIYIKCLNYINSEFEIGDNFKHGEIINGKLVKSAEEIVKEYPNAIIILTAKYDDTKKVIINQMSLLSSDFDFYYAEFMEYIYETKVLDRNIISNEALIKAAYSIKVDSDLSCNIIYDKEVLDLYCYYALNFDDIVSDITEVCSSVTSVKFLELRINSESIDNIIVDKIIEIAKINNLLHIVLVVDTNNVIDANFFDKLKSYIYKVKIFDIDTNQNYSTEIKNNLTKLNIAYEVDENYSNTAYIKNQKLSNERITTRLVLKEIYNKTNIYSQYINSDDETLDQPIQLVGIGGGLGNQIMMYLFGKYLEELSGIRVLYDDSVFFITKLRINEMNTDKKIYPHLRSDSKNLSCFCYDKLEIEAVGNAELNLLSKYYTYEQWNDIILYMNKTFPNVFRSASIILFLQDKYNFDVITDIFGYDKKIGKTLFNMKLSIYKNSRISDYIIKERFTNKFYYGCFDTEYDALCKMRKWCKSFYSLNEFDKNDIYNLSMQEQILNSNSVAVHIRRGDYISFELFKDDKVKQYLRKMVLKVKSEIKNDLKFFVFSEDLDWCRNNITKLGFDNMTDDIIYVSENKGADSYKDMLLMSKCKIVIQHVGSSFSYMGTVLGESKYCINTQYFTKNNVDKIDFVEIEDT